MSVELPEQQRRLLLMMKWGEPLIGMRINDKVHAYTFNANGFIRLLSFDNFFAGCKKWAYITDLCDEKHLWHV